MSAWLSWLELRQVAFASKALRVRIPAEPKFVLVTHFFKIAPQWIMMIIVTYLEQMISPNGSDLVSPFYMHLTPLFPLIELGVKENSSREQS